MKWKRTVSYLAVLIVLLLVSAVSMGNYQIIDETVSDQSATSDTTESLLQQTERTDGGYFTMIDEQEKVIDYTARFLSKGDEFINAENMRYQVTSVEGDYAHARLVGEEAEVKMSSSTPGATWSQLIAKENNPSVAIYHTHSDESYVPTDGTESIYGNGGIFKVGKTFVGKLRDLGFKVVHSIRSHDPHDINAYYRSRRTAVELLKKKPSALFDVHRDAVPPQVYATKVEGEDITRVKFVVGRTNPNYQANLEFAKELKAAVDKEHPDVIQGILISKSDFNQDLTPRSALLEVGAHTNDREAAQAGISLFAEALPAVLGAPEGPVAPPSVPEERGAWKAAILAVLLVIAVVFGYLYINTGSVQGAVDHLNNLLNRLKEGNK